MAKLKQTQVSRLSIKRYLLIIVSALVLYAISASIAARGNISGIEYQIFNFFYNLPRISSLIVLAITQLGSAWFLLTLIAVFLVNRRKSLAARLLVVGSVTYVMVELSKALVGRLRPEFILSDIAPREQFVTGMGFPSGHTALVTVMGIILLSHLPKSYRWLAPVVIVLVGLSRIYLGVHAPLDVVGGFCIGIVVATSYYLGVNLAKKTSLAKRIKRA